MKKSYALIIIVFACLNSVFAQSSPRSFKGRVVDSATLKPLGDASICIYRASDTSLLNFGFTTPNGNFQLTTKYPDSLIIIISLFGFGEYVKKEPAALGWDYHHYPDIKLPLLPLTLKGYTIRSSAISMKGDTIEINASKFKVLPGSDVAQLFKKIPGFEVSVKGEIKVNGSPVTKIMVDGSDFFGNNPGMVSKNLTADMVETVQVFEDLNEDGSPKEESSKVINLKLKKGKRNGTFGDVMAGYGTKQRYEAGIRLNNFKNDRKFSFVLNSNNINETGFDFGFQNWHSAYAAQRNGGTNNDDFYYYTYGDNRGEGNINNKLNSGFTYFNEFSGKRKLSFNIYGNRNNYNSIEASKNISPINDSTQRSNTDSSVLNGLAVSANFDVSFTKEIDSTGEFELGFNTSMSDNRNNSNNTNIIRLNDVLLNKGISSIRNTSGNTRMGLTGNYYRYLRKNKDYMFSLNTNYNMFDNDNRSFQFVENTRDTFNNLNERLTKSNEFLVKLFGKMPVYKKLLFNISADRWVQINASEQLSRNAQNRFSSGFEQTYQNRIDTLSIQLDNRMEQYTFKPYMSIRKKFFYVASGVTFMKMNITNKFRDSAEAISNDYSKLLPYFLLSYYPGNMYAFINISKSTEFPTISELLPILNIANNYERRTGNRNLSPEDNYGFRSYCSLYKLKGFRYLHFSFNGSMSDNAKIMVNRQTEDGIIIKTPQNARGKKELGGQLNMSKKITKVISFSTFLNGETKRNPLIINEEVAFGTNNTLTFSPGISFSKSDSLDLSVNLTYNYTDYRNSLNQTLNFRQNTFTYNFSVRTVLNSGTELSSTIDVSDQRNVPGIGRIVPVWNAYIQQPLTKNGKYNLKLSAYDILKQNTNITRFASENFIYINQSNRLQQYFMLTLIYKIKKMGGDNEGMDYVY
jgi:hypothetical protein